MEHQKTAEIFKAFCDENRLQILSQLKNGEACACVLLEHLNIRQSTLSHHMAILVKAGIVTGRKEGKWTHYKLSEEGFIQAQKCLEHMKPLHNQMKVCCSSE